MQYWMSNSLCAGTRLLYYGTVYWRVLQASRLHKACNDAYWHRQLEQQRQFYETKLQEMQQQRQESTFAAEVSSQ